MLKVKNAELTASWHWYAIDVEVGCDGQRVEATVSLVHRWDSNSDSDEMEILGVDPPEMMGVVEDHEASLIASSLRLLAKK